MVDRRVVARIAVQQEKSPQRVASCMDNGLE